MTFAEALAGHEPTVDDRGQELFQFFLGREARDAIIHALGDRRLGDSIRPDPVAVLTNLKELADALQDSIESRMGRELRARDLPREWHRAQAHLMSAGRSEEESTAPVATDSDDDVAAFAAEALEISPGEHLAAGDVYRAYLQWCEAKSIRPRTAKHFCQRLGTRRAFEGHRTRLVLNSHLRGVE